MRKTINAHRPRLFSRRFIRSELATLDLFRTFSRSEEKARQGDCRVSSGPLSPGTAVNAVCGLRMLQRGRVLGYDERSAQYLVQFDNQDFGNLLCPDFEVARVQQNPEEEREVISSRMLEGTFITDLIKRYCAHF